MCAELWGAVSAAVTWAVGAAGALAVSRLAFTRPPPWVSQFRIYRSKLVFLLHVGDNNLQGFWVFTHQYIEVFLYTRK